MKCFLLCLRIDWCCDRVVLDMHIFLLLCWLCNIRITMISAQMPERPTKSTKAPRVKTSPSTIEYHKFLQMQRDIKEEKYKFAYNPSWGLEPYWVDGEHVLSTFKEDLSRNITTTKMPLVCGEECNYMLRRVKHVCAHKSDYNTVNGCVGYYCPGKPGEDLDYGFKTFDTYCEFLDAECRAPFTDGRYVLVYVGKCQKTEEIFKPLWEAWQPVSRMNKYISEFYSRHPRTLAPPTFVFGTRSFTPHQKEG